jgi:purine-nucleoside/S-methyl-5'-thioadenosine phosphorylase / adenosine deaminase
MTQLKNNLWFDAEWSVPKHIRAGTTIRTGGISSSPYDEFNLAQHVGDDVNAVNQNRENLIKSLKLPSEPVWLNQTHSSKVITINSEVKNNNADASFATEKQKVCVVMTADCVPILLCDQNGTKVGAVHAGWRGICNGIIENSLKQFSDMNSVIAWIGPCISQKHYEIGSDVYESCLNHSNLLIDGFHQTNKHHWQANLAQMVKILMKKEKVGSIYECDLCTYEMEDKFYSYRRDGVTGRTATMIWME